MHSTRTVHVQHTYSTVQYTYSTCTVHVQYTYSTRTVHVQYTYSTRTAHVQHTYSTRTVHVQYTYSTRTVHVQYTYSTCTVLLLELCLPIHPNPSDVRPVARGVSQAGQTLYTFDIIKSTLGVHFSFIEAIKNDPAPTTGLDVSQLALQIRCAGWHTV